MFIIVLALAFCSAFGGFSLFAPPGESSALRSSPFDQQREKPRILHLILILGGIEHMGGR